MVAGDEMIRCAYKPMDVVCNNEAVAVFMGGSICESCQEMAKDMLRFCDGLD